METYDPRQVKLVVAGRILTGFASNTFVTSEKESNNYSSHVGAQGVVSRTRSADPRGTISVTIKQTSPDVGFLNGLAKSTDLFQAEVIDRNTNKVNAGGNECWIEKPASIERGNEEQEQQWNIRVADYDQEIN
ncbi:hypothetical protein J2S78_002058 [Salibacterium salarium]|uniref:phage structural protein n=1 Tax=Salibacterium salarium TaxID=284579 RepID=UPI002782005D|nr:DUF3277 domain-containing protein [Salibacterium salarium]MDQ0299638.1 hypothetical protein [Salibacterium salarium]